jgi:phosphohistidine phosphatase
MQSPRSSCFGNTAYRRYLAELLRIGSESSSPVVIAYLVRHGDAVPASENPKRPLSPAGLEAVEQIARLARERQVRVSAIYHSEILRAKETAEILAEYLMPPSGVKAIAGLLPEDDPMAGKVELEAATDPIMLVGHLPYMSRLAALLVRGDMEAPVIEFQPAAIVCCSKTAARWKIDWHLAPSAR